MSLSKTVKEFIEENSELIESEDWNSLYDKTRSSNVDVCELTEAFYEVGLNPLDGMTSIPPHFLEGSTIKNFSVPNNITSILQDAFYGSKLSTIQLPEGLTTIDNGAFTGSSLLKVELPTTCNKLGDDCFRRTQLTKIDLSHVGSLGEGCFQDCKSLEDVIIGSNMRVLPDFVFSGDTNLKELVLPINITKISSWALDRSKIEKLIIENPDIKIGAGAFSDVQIDLVIFKGTVNEWWAKGISDSPLRRVECLDETILSVDEWN